MSEHEIHPDDMVELTQDEIDEAKAYAPNPPAEKEPIKAITAYLVVQMPDGSYVAFTDANTPLELEREATLHDIHAGACQTQRDVMIMHMTQNVVQNTVAAMMQAMAAQMQAVQDQALVKQVMASPAGGVPILNPNRAQRRHTH
ncbi:MAG TPA: hypothetical protein VFI41_04900 [Gemmatimonadales bacterium]|nr:hypothetical protein [Gemmatimonadales bacterium]